MKKISLVAVLLMVVFIVSVPAFAAETEAPAGTKPPAAFNFLYGVFIPEPGGISPIQFTGGDFPGKSSVGGQQAGTKPPAAFNFLYGVFIPVQGSPIQFTGGDFPGKSSLGGK
jgi:hypothetical protein